MLLRTKLLELKEPLGTKVLKVLKARLVREDLEGRMDLLVSMGYRENKVHRVPLVYLDKMAVTGFPVSMDPLVHLAKWVHKERRAP